MVAYIKHFETENKNSAIPILPKLRDSFDHYLSSLSYPTFINYFPVSFLVVLFYFNYQL